MEKNKYNIIYGLKDPRNDVYQYIGKSTVGKSRALSHLTNSSSPYVKEWIELLHEKFLYPIVEIIEEVEDLEELANRERYWINYFYNVNDELLNENSISTNLNETRSDEDEKEFNYILGFIYEVKNILKKERTYRKLTQEEVAKLAGMSRSTISLCEQGNNVSFSSIQKYFLTLKGIDILTKESKQRIRHNTE